MRDLQGAGSLSCPPLSVAATLPYRWYNPRVTDLPSTLAAAPYRLVAVSTPVLQEPREGAEWVTEAVLGEPAHLLGIAGEWARIALPLQPSPLHELGYPGWSPASSLRESGEQPSLQTVAGRAPLCDNDGRTLAHLPMGALLARDGLPPGPAGVPVRTGSGELRYVAEADTEPWPPCPRGGRELILRTLQVWRGLPYVWGGTSSLTGTDCSGLTHRTYGRAGVIIPRDAADQFEAAPRKAPHTLDGALPGDLVFFQHAESARIDHVGVYLGDAEYLSANGATGSVSVDPVLASAHPYVGWASYLPD